MPTVLSRFDTAYGPGQSHPHVCADPRKQCIPRAEVRAKYFQRGNTGANESNGYYVRDSQDHY